MELYNGQLFLEKYEVSHLLGEGAFSRVYKARQTLLDRDVAIKVLHIKDPSALRRFRLEAKIIAHLESASIVRVHDHGELDDAGYMVLEFIAGRTLRDVIDWRGPFSEGRALGVLTQLLDGLREAHELGVVHRDLKPANIIVSQSDETQPLDQVKILDFGMAKLTTEDIRVTNQHHITERGAMVGTLRYMAPEQARGIPPVPATDLFSLGLIVYEMLTAKHPYGHLSNEIQMAAELAQHKPVELPESLNISTGFRAILARLLAKKLEDRYVSAEEVLRDLNGLDEDTMMDAEYDEYAAQPRVRPAFTTPSPPAERSYVSVMGKPGSGQIPMPRASNDVTSQHVAASLPPPLTTWIEPRIALAFAVGVIVGTMVSTVAFLVV